MQKVLGAFIIIGCVLGGYAMANGDMRVLWQPAEVVIILGAAIGSLVVGNPKEVLIEMLHQIKGVFAYQRRGEEFQRQLLMLLYELLEMVDVGGLKVLDSHIEEPEQSDLFVRYPLILQEKNLMAFIADNFRLMAMGKISAHELEGFLEQELEAMETRHAEEMEVRYAFSEKGLEVWPMFPGKKLFRTLEPEAFDGRVSQEFRTKDAESGERGVTLLMGRLASGVTSYFQASPVEPPTAGSGEDEDDNDYTDATGFVDPIDARFEEYYRAQVAGDEAEPEYSC